MLRNLREFHYPRSLDEALAILDRYDSKAAVVAGGTTLGRVDDAKIEAAIDITRLGLDFVKEDRASLRIGATTSFQDLADSKKLQKFAGGVLSTAALVQSSRLMRNAMTLGGTIVMQTPGSELQPALLALDAQVIICGKIERVIPMAEFIAQARYRQLGRNEIVTEVRIPREMAEWRGSYQVFQRTLSDPPIVIACATLAESDGKCADARCVVAAVSRRAVRSEAAEKKLTGRKLSPTYFDGASKLALKGLEVVSDWRGSREYRLHVAQVLMRRTLADAWGKGEA